MLNNIVRFPIYTLSTKLSQPERESLFARIREQSTTPSEYLRRLIREDNRRADSEALVALSLDELARNQAMQCQQLNELQRELPSIFQDIANQLNTLNQHLIQAVEYQEQQRQQILDAYAGTADLVVAAIQECHTILDADNTILESIERRLRAGGR